MNVAYEDRVMGASRLRQDPEAREIRRYSCGHEWVGSALVSADTRRLTVEGRSSEETVDPVDQEVEDDEEP